MAKTKRVALYLRVSTDGQSVENQRLALQAVAAQLERGGRVADVGYRPVKRPVPRFDRRKLGAAWHHGRDIPLGSRGRFDRDQAFRRLPSFRGGRPERPNRLEPARQERLGHAALRGGPARA